MDSAPLCIRELREAVFWDIRLRLGKYKNQEPVGLYLLYMSIIYVSTYITLYEVNPDYVQNKTINTYKLNKPTTPQTDYYSFMPNIPRV